MSEEFGLRDYLDEKFKDIKGDISGVHQRLDKLNGRVATVEKEQAETRGSISAWKWIAGGGGFVGLLAFIKGIFLQ